MCALRETYKSDAKAMEEERKTYLSQTTTTRAKRRGEFSLNL